MEVGGCVDPEVKFNCCDGFCDPQVNNCDPEVGSCSPVIGGCSPEVSGCVDPEVKFNCHVVTAFETPK